MVLNSRNSPWWLPRGIGMKTSGTPESTPSLHALIRMVFVFRKPFGIANASKLGCVRLMTAKNRACMWCSVIMWASYTMRGMAQGACGVCRGSWEPVGACGSLWEPVGACGSLWVPKGAQGCPRVPKGCPRVPKGAPRVSKGTSTTCPEGVRGYQHYLP